MTFAAHRPGSRSSSSSSSSSSGSSFSTNSNGSSSMWSVPVGTERRRFLAVWLLACLANGCWLTLDAWRATQQGPHSSGVWLFIWSLGVYVLLYCGITWALVFDFSLYSRYKILMDLGHLMYCQVPHIISSFFPPGGSPVPVNFPPTHAFILMLNPLAHNLPPWCHFTLMATVVPSHLIIQHNSLAFHRPGLPPMQYLQHMLITALVPAALATLILLHSGRVDMPPSASEAPAELSGQCAKRQDVPCCPADSPRHRGVPGGSAVHRFLWLFHRAQLQFQANSRPLLTALACAMTLTQLIQALFVFAAGRGKMEVTMPMAELVASLVSMYILGSSNVLTDIQPRLTSALNLVYDLVPVHIANALLDQEQSSLSPTPRHSCAGFPLPYRRHSTCGGSAAVAARPLQPRPSVEADGPRGCRDDPDAISPAHKLHMEQHPMLRPTTDPEPAAAAADARQPDVAPTLVQRMLCALTGPDDRLPGHQVKLPCVMEEPSSEDIDRAASLATWHESASILFADIVGFTECSQAVTPREVMRMLNELYSRYDGLCMGDSKVAKIETIGDCYLAATGLLHNDPDHALTMLRFAADITKAAQEVLMPHNGRPVQVRVGIHSGRVMSGVVGRIRKRFCLFGDTVNTASRMESHGVPGRIHLSAATRDLVMLSGQQGMWSLECRGTIHIKGKGEMTTYFAEPAPSLSEADPSMS